jgi:thiol-disulfide isomerase/thioredoxin
MGTIALTLLALTADPAASRGVLLDFSATWCMPCQQMNPTVSRLMRQGYAIRKVDVDQEPELARKYGIRSIPAFVLVVDGKEVNRITGMTSEPQLKRLLSQIPTTSAPTTPAPPSRPSAPASGLPRGQAATQVAVASNNAPPANRFSFPFPGLRSQSEPARTAAAASPQGGTPHSGEPAAVVRANLDAAETTPAVNVPPSASSASDDRPLACSTRIRVKDEKGVNFGSGTLIESQPGRSLILTCGHIFRRLNNESVIEVDIFSRGRVETFRGEVVDFDLEGDVGLLAVKSDDALPTVPVAAFGYRVQPGQQVSSVGCGGGEPPSRREIEVTALDRYLGPANIECTGTPVRGRSGGGLFAKDGRVVGVCVAADPEEQRGLYAGLPVIHDLLTRCGLLTPPVPQVPETAIVRGQSTTEEQADVRTLAAAVGSAGLGSAAVDALQSAGEAEVICIVRPLDKPRDASRVVIINRASPQFVEYLTDELNNQPQPTSAFVPHDVAKTTTDREPPPFAEAPPAKQPEPLQRYRRSRK